MEAGVNSIIIGMVAVVVFILIYYRLSGVVAVGALVLNLVILLGALGVFRRVIDPAWNCRDHLDSRYGH